MTGPIAYLLAVVAILASGFIAGCGTTIQGIPLGPHMRSWSTDADGCATPCHEPIGTAVAALHHLAPNHAPIVAIDEYGPDMNIVCDGESCGFSGYHGFFAFRFADEAELVVAVTCPGIAMCAATTGRPSWY